MVQPSRPVDGDVGQAVVEADGAGDAGAGVGADKRPQAVKEGAVVVDVEAGGGRGDGGGGGRQGGRREKVDVVGGVELGQLGAVEGARALKRKRGGEG